MLIKDSDRWSRRKRGYFIVLVTDLLLMKKTNRWIDNLMAIVEEEVTGKVYVISPECIDKFVIEETDETNGMTIL